MSQIPDQKNPGAAAPLPWQSGTLNNVRALVDLALRQIGVGAQGTTSSDADIADAVMNLNMMLANWQRRRWLVPNLVDHCFMATGQSVYTIGPGGDLDLPLRPSQIDAAYARLLSDASGRSTPGEFSPDDYDGEFVLPKNGLDASGSWPVDYPLQEIPSYEDYSAISIKALRSWPNYYHYNPAFPLGEFRPWPIPGGTQIWELHVLFNEILPASLTPDSQIDLPPEYADAIMWALAARLAPSYGQEASPTVTANAKAAIATLRTANHQVPTLGMPATLTSGDNPFCWPGLQIRRL